MQYDLWDTETSNHFGHFEDEWEVLAIVRTLIAHYGDEYANGLGLGRVTAGGEMLEPLSGAALIARVNEVLAESQDAETPRGAAIASTAWSAVRKRSHGPLES